MTVCGNPLSRSQLGVKRTLPIALHMSANDPKRTSNASSTMTREIGPLCRHRNLIQRFDSNSCGNFNGKLGDMRFGSKLAFSHRRRSLFGRDCSNDYSNIFGNFGIKRFGNRAGTELPCFYRRRKFIQDDIGRTSSSSRSRGSSIGNFVRQRFGSRAGMRGRYLCRRLDIMQDHLSRSRSGSGRSGINNFASKRFGSHARRRLPCFHRRRDLIQDDVGRSQCGGCGLSGSIGKSPASALALPATAATASCTADMIASRIYSLLRA